MSDQTGSPPTEEEQAAAAAAPPPAPDPEPTPEPQAASDPNRLYGVFTERQLDVSSAAGRKESGEKLAELAHEGKVTVLVRIGNVMAVGPKKALSNLGAIKPLDGDYEVIADSQRNRYGKVKTTTKVDVSIG